MIVDPSHSGGRRNLVVPLSRAAIAVGADGIIVDVHPHPETALCDGPQALVESDLRELASVATHLSPLVGRTLTQALDALREPDHQTGVGRAGGPVRPADLVGTTCMQS